ncbi:protein TonB [Ciceribacter lividus]|uniref:Protein TonB n=1 Tax=Ciceribacter lividus TaxID=1197950 RepID=A0A6I7HNM6_9HYPH|nr:energy transducer TonB [Ciceribacter lividus]RCW24134.1 protein TonB [Ciceribacter lividus]
MTVLLNDFRRSLAGDSLAWGAAALIVASAHAAALAVMMHTPTEIGADPGPQAAIMIELAAEPEATEPREEEIVPDNVDADEIISPAADPAPAPDEPKPLETSDTTTPEPLAPAEDRPAEKVIPSPEPTTVPPQQEEPDPVEQQVLAALENVEVPLPVTRPAPPTPAPAHKTPPPSQAARKAKIDVTKSERTAAPETTAGRGAAVSPARWQSRLMAHLERRKRYPAAARSAHEEGTVYVRFRIDTSGNVLSVSLSRSSGHSTLDEAVLDLVRRASPVPAPPPGASTTIVAPVRFDIR